MKQIAAVLLLVSALMTVVYTQLLTGTMTITTEEIVSVYPILDTFTARTSGQETYPNVIHLDYNHGGFDGTETVRIAVELVMADIDLQTGFLWLTIQIKDGSAVKGIITLNTPYVEFETAVPSPLTFQDYDVTLIYRTGAQELAGVQFDLSVTILGVS